MFYPEGWSESERAQKREYLRGEFEVVAEYLDRRDGKRWRPMSADEFTSFDPVHFTRALIDAVGGAQCLCATAASPGRGRPRKDNFNKFVGMMMNFLMPPWAAPKNRAEARRRRKVVAVAKPEPAKYVAVAATGVRRSPEERAARLFVVWPVPKEVAPKRVSAATAVTIAVAEAGVIPAPHDEADFTRARKRIEAVYRRWYDTCFLPCPDGAMEALKTWFIAALRTRQDARP